MATCNVARGKCGKANMHQKEIVSQNPRQVSAAFRLIKSFEYIELGCWRRPREPSGAPAGGGVETSRGALWAPWARGRKSDEFLMETRFHFLDKFVPENQHSCVGKTLTR